MRILHTADWHLGCVLHGVSLLEEQQYILQQFIKVVEDTRPDVILLAGDVYDRAVPPNEAVDLLDEILSELVLRLEVPTLLITGNHDSQPRLKFSSRILARNKLHIITTPCPQATPVKLADAHGPVLFYTFPYCEPVMARHRLACDAIRDHQGAMQSWTPRVWQQHATDARAVLVTHAFVQGSSVSGSERDISVGGAGLVDAACFEGFHYVALGHLHAPQRVGAEDHIQYSGSPLKYSFAEAEHAKSVTLVELAKDGSVAYERLPLTPRRDVRVVSGHLADVLSGKSDQGAREDYILVRLLDIGALHDPMHRLRERYPNVLHLELLQENAPRVVQSLQGDHRQLSEVELFDAFFEQMMGEKLSEEEKALFVGIVERLRQDGGES